MKKLILISSLLAAGTMAANAAILTYVGGYDSFASGTELADKLLETDTAGTNTLSATLSGDSEKLVVGSSLSLSGANAAFGTISGASNDSNDGLLFVMTFDSITAVTQTLLSFQLAGNGANFVITPDATNGLSETTLSIVWSSSSNNDGTAYTFASTIDLSISAGTPLTIAFGYQRNSNVGAFVYVNDTLITGASSGSTAFKVGGAICATNSGASSVVVGGSQIITSTGGPAGDFTLDNVYAYSLSDSALTSSQLSSLVAAANLRAIPEPSMFGLFAGTLVLGLAGTRRRRSKK